MIKLKDILNEWTKKPPTEKRWSKSFSGNTGLTEFEQNGGKDTLKEMPYSKIKGGKHASIYDMKKEMEEGKFDPKNPNINVHGLYTVHLKLLEKTVKRDLKHLMDDIGYESGAKKLNWYLYEKNAVQSKIKGLWEVYQQMNSSQYKRAVTMYKRKR